MACNRKTGMDTPVFTSAVPVGSTLNVVGYVGSAPGQATFAGTVIEIFKSDRDPSAFGEGPLYVGSLTPSSRLWKQIWLAYVSTETSLGNSGATYVRPNDTITFALAVNTFT